METCDCLYYFNSHHFQLCLDTEPVAGKRVFIERHVPRLSRYNTSDSLKCKIVSRASTLPQALFCATKVLAAPQAGFAEGNTTSTTTHLHMQMRIHMHMHMRVRMHMRMYLHMPVHIHLHMQMHTHVHMQPKSCTIGRDA